MTQRVKDVLAFGVANQWKFQEMLELYFLTDDEFIFRNHNDNPFAKTDCEVQYGDIIITIEIETYQREIWKTSYKEVISLWKRGISIPRRRKNKADIWIKTNKSHNSFMAVWLKHHTHELIQRDLYVERNKKTKDYENNQFFEVPWTVAEQCDTIVFDDLDKLKHLIIAIAHEKSNEQKEENKP